MRISPTHTLRNFDRGAQDWPKDLATSTICDMSVSRSCRNRGSSGRTLVIEDVRPAEVHSLYCGWTGVLEADNIQARPTKEEQPFAPRIDCGSSDKPCLEHSGVAVLTGHAVEVEHDSDTHDDEHAGEFVRVGNGLGVVCVHEVVVIED